MFYYRVSFFFLKKKVILPNQVYAQVGALSTTKVSFTELYGVGSILIVHSYSAFLSGCKLISNTCWLINYNDSSNARMKENAYKEID